MRRFRSPDKTTIYWTICKEQPCIWCRNQIQGCFDILLLKIALDAVFLELADGGQTVHRVPGKPADALGHYEVDLNVVFDTKWKGRLWVTMPRNGLISRVFTVSPVYPLGLWKLFFFMKISLEAWSKVATYPSLFSCRGKIKKCEEKYNCVEKIKMFQWKVIRFTLMIYSIKSFDGFWCSDYTTFVLRMKYSQASFSALESFGGR